MPYAELQDGLSAESQTLLAAFPDAVMLVTQAGIITANNPMAETLFGYPPQALYGQPLVMLLPERYHALAMARLLERDDVPPLDPAGPLVGLRADGGEFPLALQCRPCPLAHEPLSLVVLRPMPALSVERALEVSEQRFQQVIDLVPHFIFAKDTDGRFIVVNRATAEAYGTTVAALLGQTDADVAASASAVAQFRADDLAVLQSGQAKIIPEEQITDAHGRVRLLSTIKIPFTFSGTTLPAVLGVAVDITASKAQERALEASRHFAQQIAHTMPGIVYLYDVNLHQTVYTNDCLKDILGYTPEDITPLEGDGLRHLMHPEDWQCYRDHVHRLLRSREEETREFEGRLRHADGSWVWLLTRDVVFSRHTDGTPHLILGVAHDFTARKQAETEAAQRATEICRLNAELEQRVQERTAQLAATNRELEAFCYSVSHDLRAPLRAINGFSQALLDDYGHQLASEGQHYLQRVRAGSQRMAQLIDDLLNLSRLTRHEMCYTRVHLSALVANIAAELHATQPQRQVRWNIMPDLYVEADVSLLRIALGNLLSNAWKYTSKHAQAHITFGMTTVQGQEAYLVRDDGAGFDMAYAAKLFGAFQRLHRPDEFEGTGIGLATVERIMHRHGGHVWAEGAVERGATFYFTLPRASQPPPSPPYSVATRKSMPGASSDLLC